MRFFTIALCCIVLAGCASTRHAPPKCRGEYRPINQVNETVPATPATEEVQGVQ